MLRIVRNVHLKIVHEPKHSGYAFVLITIIVLHAHWSLHGNEIETQLVKGDQGKHIDLL